MPPAWIFHHAGAQAYAYGGLLVTRLMPQVVGLNRLNASLPHTATGIPLGAEITACQASLAIPYPDKETAHPITTSVVTAHLTSLHARACCGH